MWKFNRTMRNIRMFIKNIGVLIGWIVVLAGGGAYMTVLASQALSTL